MKKIILEIPHRAKPFVWVADSDQQIIDAAISREGPFIDEEFGGPENLTLDDAAEALFHDLHYGEVMTEQEALGFVAGQTTVEHQKDLAILAVKEVLGHIKELSK